MTVSPTTIPPDFHLTLTDEQGFELGLTLCNLKGEEDPTALGEAGSPRTATRVAQGGGGYDDFKEPFTPILQSDFAAGRGNDDFTRDSSRYYDSEGIDATSGEVTLAPSSSDVSGIGGGVTAPLVVYGEEYLYADRLYAAAFFLAQTNTLTPSGPITSATIRVMSIVGNPGSLTVYIRSNINNLPGNTLTSDSRECTVGDNVFDFSPPISLTEGTPYWLVVKGQVPAEAGNHYKLLFAQEGGAPTSYKSSNGTDWVSDIGNTIAFSLPTEDPTHIEFEYKGATYAVERKAGSISRLYLNGHRGLAQSNSDNLLRIKTGLTLLANELVGKCVKITGGPGSAEEDPVRKIVSNTTDGICTVEAPWKITHTTATEYVILGENWFTEITGHGFTGAVTDVEVMDDIVYFAQGDSIALRRFRAINNAGTWVNQFEADGTAKATFIRFIPDDTGVRRLWKAKLDGTVQSAIPSAWGTPNTWGTEIQAGNKNSRVTGLAAYGNPIVPWAMKEDAFGSIRNNVYAQSPNSNLLASVKHHNNGRAWMMHDVYLYFPVRNSLERYYDSRMDDIGPDRDEGLPTLRQGPITSLMPYPGRFYAALDAGITGYSAVFVNNLVGSRAGWHELYRGAIGKRITNLHLQVVPTDNFDRLWFAEGRTLKWLPVAKNPKYLPDYPYRYTGYLVTSWYYTQFRDRVKYWDAVTVFAENLSAGHQEIAIEYQTDNETAWHALSAPFTTSPSERQILSAGRDVAGKRIRFRITLTTDDQYKTPRLQAILIDGVTRIAPNKIYNLVFLVKDAQQNLNGRSTHITPEALKAKIEAWADSSQFPRPLKLHHCRQMYDDQWVFVEPATWKILNMVVKPSNEIRLVGMVTLRGL
jgi:hypothetical protein